MENKPLRVLQIVPGIELVDGISCLVMNWYRNIDRTKVQFDFLVLYKRDVNFGKEIASMGGKIYYLPSYKNIFSYLAAVKKVFKNGHYRVIHSHITQFNLFFFPFAAFYGVKNIFLHSHGVKYSENFVKGIINRFMLFCVRGFVTRRFACSEAAGRFLFGGKKFEVIVNCIDLRKFYPDAQDGAAKRKELGLSDKFVLCNLGRFSRGKNHIFMLNILSSALKLNPSCVLLLAGSGPLEEKIKKIAAARGIAKNIIFLGPRTDVPSLYRAADAFIMPSLHEGFGLSAVEAQACGTRCFVSEFVPPEVRAANIKVLPLYKGAEFWAEEILRQFKCVNPAEFFKNAGLDAAAAALRWERIYTDCI